MLKSLQIRNYALIDELEIAIEEGFTIITGETGAGKSILLGALSLLTGQRADRAALQDRDKKCVVEGVFHIANYGLRPFFDRYDLDYENHTVIRREITPAGKSRAFINDTPVNLAQLKELGQRLIDIHSQHETLDLGQTTFQLSVLDAYASQLDAVADYRKVFGQYREAELALEDLHERQRKARVEQDYHQFLFQELEEASVQEGEAVNLQQELDTLSNAEDIKSRIFTASQGLNGENEALIPQLRTIVAQLEPVGEYHKTLASILERLRSSFIELEDLSSELDDLQDTIDYDAERIAEVNDRLDVVNKLLHKHGVQDTVELKRIHQELDHKLSSLTSLDDEITKREQELERLQKDLLNRGKKLSAARKKKIPGLEKAIHAMLADLGMPNGRFQVTLQQLESVGRNGLDRIEFLFSANRGSTPQPIGKVASGGELSRLMLSLKAVISQLTALPTIIFDEIDSGISGDIAGKTARILQSMAASMQVISITHLPQVASKGHQHFKVFKEVRKGTTRSVIRPLSKAERLEEVAKMLSGEEMTSQALENARVLLEQ